MACKYCQTKVARSTSIEEEYDMTIHSLADALLALEAAISLMDINGINKYTNQVNMYHREVSRMKPYDWHADAQIVMRNMRR